MTITAAATKYRYEGNGATAAFAYTSRVYAQTDLKVDILVRTTSALVETLTLTTDYSVTIASNGQATVTITNGAKIPSNTQDILLRLDLPQTQTTELPTGTPFPAKVVETSLDKLTSISQALAEVDSRSMKYAAQSPATNPILPEPVNDATIAFDGTDGAFKIGPTIGDIADAEANAAIATAAAAAAQAAVATVALNNYTATTAPTVNDDSGDGYSVGSVWVDVNTDLSYELVDATLGAAVWKEQVDTNSTQILAGKTLTNPTINAGSGVIVLPAATSPAQTAEGSVVWDSDDDLLTVGTGAARKTMVDTNSTQTLTNKTLTSPNASGVVLAAGTVSQAPLYLMAGTNLTVPSAGADEFDGRVRYFTAQKRGYLKNPQAYILDTNLAGANVATAQSPLGVGVSIDGGTEYEFEGTYYLSKVAGATSHTISLLFAGTATLNRLNYDYISSANTTSLATATAGLRGNINVATASVITGAIASANSFVVVRIHGTMSVAGSGTFIPQYILSAAPGGAYTAVAGSGFKIWPVGVTGGNINIGTWA